MSLSEPASMFPGAGGQYTFVSELTSRKFRPVASFYSGWITLLGWISLTASAPYAAANLIQGLITLSNPDYVPERWKVTLIYMAILLLSFILNQWFSKILPLLETMIMSFHIIFFFAILIAAAVLPPTRNSVSFVFTEVQNLSGWENDGVAWCLGMLTSAYILVGKLCTKPILHHRLITFLGYDSATHISDEMSNPRIGVPRAMIGSIVINGTMGFAVLIAVLFGMGTIENALSAQTGFPIIEIFLYMTRGNNAATAAMTSTIIVSASLATVGLSASSSRTFWAFARDNGPPFSAQLSKLGVRSRIPTNALVVITIVLLLLGLLNIASTAAFGAILSLTVVSLEVSYLMPVVAMLYRRIFTPKLLTYGPWRLNPVVGIVANVVAISYILFITAFLLLPAAMPVTALNMNYASAVIGAVLIFATVDWVARGRFCYTGALNHGIN